MDKKQRPPVEWDRAVKEFTEGGITLQIDRLPLGKPRFSGSVGILREGQQENRFTSRMPVRYKYEAGIVTFEGRPPRGVVDRLFDEAEKWIKAEVEAAQVRYEERQAKRTQDAQKRQPKT